MPQDAQALWKAELDTSLLDERLENAMRRVSGSIGADITMDKARMRTLKDTAAQAFEAGTNSAGPLFMRAGQGLLEAGLCKIGSATAPKDIAGEILFEFYKEAVTAFSAARLSLEGSATAFLQQSGKSEAACASVIAAANETFMTPPTDIFTKEAEPFIKVIATPATQAAMGAVVGLAGTIALLRSPHLGFIVAALCGGGMYYFARARNSRRCENLVRHLPRHLYQMLVREWKANVRKYADTVNAGLAPQGQCPQSVAATPQAG